MNLWKSGIVHFFALGFVLGAVVLFTTFGIGPDRVSAGDVVAVAEAAPVQ
jgi:mannose/fructose/N-acetylgalactosamine-specific phosphotransferase system component IIC